MLTVVCWLWRGWRPLYSFHNVNIAQRMIAANLKIPHRFVCVTDMPEGIECETIPLFDTPHVHTHPRQPNCYKRLNVFRPDAAEVFGSDLILSIDLDFVAFDDLTPLITDDDFRIVTGMQSPYNGSMYMVRAGSRPKVWTDFDPVHSPVTLSTLRRKDGRPYIGSDQAWISYKLPGARTWGPEDGVYQFFRVKQTRGTMQVPPRIMFFPGLTKPWDVSMDRQWPEFRAKYLSYRSSADIV